jgi:hypothetical protein
MRQRKYEESSFVIFFIALLPLGLMILGMRALGLLRPGDSDILLVITGLTAAAAFIYCVIRYINRRDDPDDRRPPDDP